MKKRDDNMSIFLMKMVIILFVVSVISGCIAIYFPA